jgi:hypothetical protein
MLQQMLTVIRGMKDVEKLDKLLAAVIVRFVYLEGSEATLKRLRKMIEAVKG